MIFLRIFLNNETKRKNNCYWPNCTRHYWSKLPFRFIPLRPSRIRPSRLRPSAPRTITQIILVKTRFYVSIFIQYPESILI